MKTLSIIVACYNEEKNIADTIKRIYDVVPKAEIIIVDDGSTDDTKGVSIETANKLNIKGFKYVGYMPNRGKGYAIK